jgi:hypothetical protein
METCPCFDVSTKLHGVTFHKSLISSSIFVQENSVHYLLNWKVIKCVYSVSPLHLDWKHLFTHRRPKTECFALIQMEPQFYHIQSPVNKNQYRSY